MIGYIAQEYNEIYDRIFKYVIATSGSGDMVIWDL